jgi:hypothetical protein
VSLRVDLAALPAEIARFGAGALLATAPAAGPPHVSSVWVTVAGADLAMRVGRTTLANVVARPTVTLAWPSIDGEYCLVVDADTLEATPERFVVRPTSAVLHRLARPGP